MKKPRVIARYTPLAERTLDNTRPVRATALAIEIVDHILSELPILVMKNERQELLVATVRKILDKTRNNPL